MSKKAIITEMFDDIAPHYDFLNHFLSLSIDKTWRNKTAKFIQSCNPCSILDIATGTGDMAILLAEKCPDANITGSDLSENMLNIGKEKVKKRHLDTRISFVTGDACELPFEAECFDAITVAFGVRNFHDIEKGLLEMQRVLKPQGHIAILEFSTPHNPLIKALYEFYFHKILPGIGKIISKNGSAYKYLPESVSKFPTPNEFTEIMRRCGLNCERKRSLSAGIATLYYIRRA